MKLYVFIGMCDGINDVIEPYVNESDAKKAWSEYMEMDYSVYEKDSSILDCSKHLGTAIYVSEAPLECYNPTCQIAIKWDIDDVKNVRPDLTDAQCMEVLEHVRDKHDAELGVSWITLESWADILFPLPSDKSENKKLIDTAASLYQANSNVYADYSLHDALYEASQIHGITDLHNDEDDDRYGEYEDLVYQVERQLGIAA